MSKTRETKWSNVIIGLLFLLGVLAMATCTVRGIATYFTKDTIPSLQDINKQGPILDCVGTYVSDGDLLDVGEGTDLYCTITKRAVTFNLVPNKRASKKPSLSTYILPDFGTMYYDGELTKINKYNYEAVLVETELEPRATLAITVTPSKDTIFVSMARNGNTKLRASGTFIREKHKD